MLVVGRHPLAPGTGASKSAMRSSCAWHQFGGLWGNASHCLMQTGDRHSAVTWGADASKSVVRSSCAWHRFGSPWDNASHGLTRPGDGHRFGGPWGNASHWLTRPGDRHSVVTRGTDASKGAVRSPCAWHQILFQIRLWGQYALLLTPISQAYRFGVRRPWSRGGRFRLAR